MGIDMGRDRRGIARLAQRVPVRRPGKTASAEATEKGFDEIAGIIGAGAPPSAEGAAAAAEGDAEGGGEEAEAE